MRRSTFGAAVRRVLLLLAVVPALAFVACSDDESPTVAARTVPAKVNLPEKILGLEVVEENVKTNITSVKASYLQSLGLFSFREGSKKDDELLRATLQVGRFNEVADQDKERFRNAIVGNLGSTVPVELRVGSAPVWLASGSDTNIFAWFDEQGFYVLSIRSDYPFPRTLLRRLRDSELLV